jgi:hypothetical protein
MVVYLVLELLPIMLKTLGLLHSNKMNKKKETKQTNKQQKREKSKETWDVTAFMYCRVFFFTREKKNFNCLSHKGFSK